MLPHHDYVSHIFITVQCYIKPVTSYEQIIVETIERLDMAMYYASIHNAMLMINRS